MNRLERRLSDNRHTGRPSLVFFVTAGYPTLEATEELVTALEGAGADAVEIGMPFSDPMADGPMIQLSSAVALTHGVTIPWIFDQIVAIRKRSAVPVILMGYVNPILRYGAARFFDDAAGAGVDGVILPEVPIEEWGRFDALSRSRDISGILLVAPTTSPDRIRTIDSASSGFLYAVSSTGVTGGAANEKSLEYVREVRNCVRKNPVIVGFGITTPEKAAAFVAVADGVVVGSALLRDLEGGRSVGEVAEWARGFREAMDRAVRQKSG